jgi:hypothetical protein
MLRGEFLKRTSGLVGLVLMLSVLLPANVTAQTGTSDITGTVLDAQERAVVGATVTIRNSDNGITRSQKTREGGAFTFSGVPIGTYSVEIEATGFKKSISSDVQAQVAKAASIIIKLEIGELSEQVTVTASGVESLVNATDASIGNNFNAGQIINLPLNARNVGDLLSLQPGVTPDGYVAGGRRDQANLTLDGVDVNEQQTGSTFDPVVRVNPDTVEEFRVTTLNPDATEGRSSGAQIQLVTKSGTNVFHGNAYEYHRNTLTTANDFFNNISGLPKPALIRNKKCQRQRAADFAFVDLEISKQQMAAALLTRYRYHEQDRQKKCRQHTPPAARHALDPTTFTDPSKAVSSSLRSV